MKKLILTAALLAPLAAAPAFAQVDASANVAVTQTREIPREFTSRRVLEVPAALNRGEQGQINRQGLPGNF
ncbi:MAG: hypothetical protein Q8O26_13320 [Phreatobacter sp.]|uniref:hypothetical protein n=1 Tax=Phreatobacter sp. TaxID=1966341 RepID=UPI0027333B9A|nr:hypothetical protein [Phreatobacter sp.]MDP2802856.1 hypothetical protein [Phreatobacter sp.]